MIPSLKKLLRRFIGILLTTNEDVPQRCFLAPFLFTYIIRGNDRSENKGPQIAENVKDGFLLYIYLNIVCNKIGKLIIDLHPDWAMAHRLLSFYCYLKIDRPVVNLS